MNSQVGHPSVAAHRGELFQLLLQALPAEAVHTNKQFHRLRDEGKQVVGVFADGSEATASFLVGADGVFSTTRTLMFPETPPTYAGYATWRGVVDLDTSSKWPPRSLVRSLGRGEYFGIGELSPQRYLWYATKNRAEGEPEAGGRKATLLRHFGNWHHPIPELLTATPEDEILLHPIYKMASMTPLTRGRVTLVGDAAHPVEPSLGMGASLALEDAVVLARCLQNENSIETALQRYEKSRRSRVRRIVRTSALLARPEQLENRVGCRVRDLSSRLAPEPLVRAMSRPLVTFAPE
jgi:2-polyprenyl-6-methoxyphenol hydroxylase-like FAD-dependent oxidoreductase